MVARFGGPSVEFKRNPEVAGCWRESLEMADCVTRCLGENPYSSAIEMGMLDTLWSAALFFLPLPSAPSFQK